jgi:peptidoglycan/xylan/chitin deacetylase (PgdA/CDA1 family)
MSPETFEARLSRLKQVGCSILPLVDGLKRLSDGTLPEAAVSLTFDDGMHDFFAVARPLLQKYEAPATVYVTTFYSDFRRPVFGIFCSYLLWKGAHRTLHLNQLIPGGTVHELALASARRLARHQIEEHARHAQLDAAAKDELARRLAAELGIDYGELVRREMLHVMSNDEIAQLAQADIDVQLHTHRHRTPRDKLLFLREIVDNRNRLESLTGRPARHFCYPSGVYYQEFLPWLREAGVESAVTGDPGLAHSKSQALLLPRVVDTQTKSLRDVEAWASGVMAALPRRTPLFFDRRNAVP